MRHPPLRHVLRHAGLCRAQAWHAGDPSGIMNWIVPQLLAELDGISSYPSPSTRLTYAELFHEKKRTRASWLDSRASDKGCRPLLRITLSTRFEANLNLVNVKYNPSKVVRPEPFSTNNETAESGKVKGESINTKHNIARIVS